MNQMIGANTTELRDMSAKIRSDADRLNQICIDLSGSFARTHWEGGDGDEIRADWQHRWSGQLRDVAAQLIAAANTLTKNAEQQDLTSGTDNAQQAQALSLSPWQRVLHDTGLDFGPNHDPTWQKVVEGTLTGLGIADAGRSFLTDTKAGGKLLEHGDKFLSNLAEKDGELGKLGRYGEAGWDDVSKFSESTAGRIMLADPEDLKAGANVLDEAGHFAKAAGPIAALGLVYQSYKTISDPSPHNIGDLVFNVAEVASLECPPLSIGLSVVQLAYDHPKIVENIGKGIANIAVAGVTGDVQLGTDVVHGAADIASHGVNAVKHLLHW